jgi:hypothetical protein
LIDLEAEFIFMPHEQVDANSRELNAAPFDIEWLQAGQLKHEITGVTNQTIVIESSTNLMSWQPIWTNVLSSTSTNFVDPQWVNHPHRFYRGRSN